MNPDAMTEEMQALRRLLGDAPVVTPDSLTVGLGWLLAKLKAEIAEGGGGCKQEWGTPDQVAAIYGIQRSQANVWVNQLVERGKVRRWQAETPTGGRGCMRYNMADIAAAWAVEQGAGHESRK